MRIQCLNGWSHLTPQIVDNFSHFTEKVISTKKEELVAITDHCNIQIDNPVSLLNQDTSRNFLHNSNPNAKYKLFMKATHLEQIAIDYGKSKEELTLMEQKIEMIASVSKLFNVSLLNRSRPVPI